VHISYVIREINSENKIISEANTNCIFEAVAELMLKARIKNMLGGKPTIYVLHKKGAFKNNAVFITLHYKFNFRSDLILEMETSRENAAEIKWNPINTDSMYLDEYYAKKVQLFVMKIKEFLHNRSLTITTLVVFSVKNNGHIFWKDILGGSPLVVGGLGIGIKKPFKR
jgi:hypothetical protein